MKVKDTIRSTKAFSIVARKANPYVCHSLTLAPIDSRAAAILGINLGSIASHQEFCDTLELPFPLLVDADRHVAGSYGAVKTNGKSILRSVIVVDKKGIIKCMKRGMPQDKESLDRIDQI